MESSAGFLKDLHLSKDHLSCQTLGGSRDRNLSSRHEKVSALRTLAAQMHICIKGAAHLLQADLTTLFLSCPAQRHQHELMGEILAPHHLQQLQAWGWREALGGHCQV